MAKSVSNAIKWSSITEISAKLITPFINMALARLLTPEAFGVVATLTMIISFAEIFTDAGFQKYLIQHEFQNENDKRECTDVAFWSNLSMSLFFWLLITIFANPLATIVGNPGLGHVLIIACASIPIVAISSIQMALYKRNLDFKTLFKIRIVGIMVPIFVTIPLALYFKNFWALVLGTISRDIVNAIILTYYSTWKPHFFFSFRKLKEMLSFSIWSIIDSVSIWLTLYVDVFIVGTVLSQYYLGLYKTSSAIVGSIMGLITAATTPVLFSALSRLQNDPKEFKLLFFRFQKNVAMLITPTGIIIFCFSDLITSILLGKQWMEASGFVGLWGLTSSIQIVLAHYCGEIYKAKGKPRLSVIAQWLHIIVLWPTVIITANYGFETLYIWRSWIRLEMVFVNLTIVYLFVQISPLAMLRNVFPECIAAILMAFFAFLLHPFFNNAIWWQIITIILSCIIYVSFIYLFPIERKTISQLICLILSHNNKTT